MSIASRVVGFVKTTAHSKCDKLAEPLTSEEDLRTFAQSQENEMTSTAVPVGSGERIAIDRDLDTVLNRDDNCEMEFNPGQVDSDGDNIGSVCDVNLFHPD